MKSPDSNVEEKRKAAERAAELVQDGMTVGLGSGSTAELFVRSLEARLAQGLKIRAVASSHRTERVAAEVGLPLMDLDGPLDIAVDGADAIELGSLNAIKGLGGALTREKLVALAARTFVLVGDHTKLVDHLYERQATLPVPIEVLTFGWKLTCSRLTTLGRPILRKRDGAPIVTDNGNLLLDLYNAPLVSPSNLSAAILAIPGVVDHGLFLEIAKIAYIAGAEGVLELATDR